LASFVDTTVKEIDNRLKELRGEVTKLEAARAALAGGSRPAPRAAAPSNGASAPAPAAAPARRGRRPGRPRGPRGGNTRATQALALVQKQPGITIPQIAEALKIEPNYLYRVMPKLVDEGQVKRDGQGWHPASA
jgi:Winged helix-turn-helix DNA-binding